MKRTVLTILSSFLVFLCYGQEEKIEFKERYDDLLFQQKFIISPEEREPLTKSADEKDAKLIIQDDFYENPTRLKSGPSQYDSRIELNQLDSIVDWENKILNNASAVGIIVEKEYVDRVSEQFYLVELTTSLKDRYGICPKEPFSKQASLGVGTAFLIGRDTMVTAAHVFERPLDQYYVVFGFHLLQKDDETESVFDQSEVIQLDKLLPYFNLVEFDIAAFKLKKEAKQKPLSLQMDFEEKINAPIYAIGHPLGIPQKVSLNARIIENEAENYFFYTTLDAYQGNSGSPVFDLRSNKVIGVLVSGEVDLEERGGCLISRQCKPPYCKGEKIVKIGVLESFLSNLP